VRHLPRSVLSAPAARACGLPPLCLLRCRPVLRLSHLRPLPRLPALTRSSPSSCTTTKSGRSSRPGRTRAVTVGWATLRPTSSWATTGLLLPATTLAGARCTAAGARAPGSRIRRLKGKGSGKGAAKGKMPIIPVPAPAPQKDPPRPLYGKPNEKQYDHHLRPGCLAESGQLHISCSVVESGRPQRRGSTCQSSGHHCQGLGTP
jgi:hypothetical protein